jgi:hypothetical protein
MSMSMGTGPKSAALSGTFGSFTGQNAASASGSGSGSGMKRKGLIGPDVEDGLTVDADEEFFPAGRRRAGKSLSVDLSSGRGMEQYHGGGDSEVGSHSPIVVQRALGLCKPISYSCSDDGSYAYSVFPILP